MTLTVSLCDSPSLSHRLGIEDCPRSERVTRAASGEQELHPRAGRFTGSVIDALGQWSGGPVDIREMGASTESVLGECLLSGRLEVWGYSEDARRSTVPLKSCFKE